MGGGPATEPDYTFDDRLSDDAVEVTRRSRTTGYDPLNGARAEYDSVAGERASSEDEDGEPERARLLYSKSKVYLHPTSYLRDNIPGFISIVQVGKSTDYLLAWIPEASIEGTPDYESYVLVELSSSTDQETLVTPPPPSSAHAFSIPIRTLYSLQIQPPTLSAWFGSITFSLFGGTVFPPLYFHDEESRSTVLDRDRRAAALGALGAEQKAGVSPTTVKVPPSWGGEALLGQLRKYANVVRSQLEPQLFLVNPSKADLEVHSTALWDDEAVPNEALSGLRLRNQNGGGGEESGVDGGGGGPGKRQSILHQSLEGQNNDWPDDVPGPGMDNFTFNVLNSFSRITRGARSAAQNAAQSVLSHPLAKPILKTIPEPIAQFANAPGELTRLQETAGVGAYDSARVYLAQWARVVAEEGERARTAEVVISGPGGRKVDSEVGAFEVLSSVYKISRPLSTRATHTPIVVTEWAAWFDHEGRMMIDEPEAKKRIFQRGLAHDVRKDVWPFLLQVYPWDSTTEERKSALEDKTAMYDIFCTKWAKNEDLKKTERYIEEAHRVEIDCLRTDRTHPMFLSDDIEPRSLPSDSPHPPSNTHIKAMQTILMSYVFADESRDYVQGMSDLLSPLYVVCEGDQVMTFWSFSCLMERMKRNFLKSQEGMKKQLMDLQGLIRTMDVQLYKHLESMDALNLFFSFRWILCGFKRELSFEQTLQLWEVLWTDHLGTQFHLFVALAIIEDHRDVIIRYLREFDEILKYVNELTGTLDVQAIMADAEVLYATFQKVVHAVDLQEAEKKSGQSAGGNELRRRKNGGAGEEKEGDEEEEGEEYPPKDQKGKQKEVVEREERRVVVEGLTIEGELRALLKENQKQ